MSTMELIGANSTIISIGSPAAANTAVAVMVAVPGTPTVPMLTRVVIRTRRIYCTAEYSIFNPWIANTASKVGQIPAQPGIPIFAPNGTTREEIFSETPAFLRHLSVAGIVPILLWVVKAITCAGQIC